MVGVGDITMLHAPAYRDFDLAQLHLLCDRDEALLARRARQWGVARSTSDFQQVLADTAVDIVEVNTPHHLHRPMVEQALAAGKHVACQKPIATTVADAEAMCQAAEGASGAFRVIENFVFYPPYVLAKQLLDAGEIGEPISIRFKLGTSFFGSRWIPLKTEIWHLLESERGRGQAVFDDGYHKLSLAIHFLGPIASVKGFLGRSLRYVDEPGHLIWRYQDSPALGSFDIALSPALHTRSDYFPADERVEIVGSRGSLLMSRCTGQICDDPPLVLVRDGRRTLFDDLEADWQASFTAGIRDFPKAILEDRQSLISARRATDILRFALALIMAAREGREIIPAEVDDERVRRSLQRAGRSW